MSATENADGMEDSATSASVVTSFTSSDADDEGLGTTTYSVSTSTSDAESTASSSTVTEVRHKRYVVTSSAGRLSSIPAGDPVGHEPPSAPTADIVALNARFMYYVDRVRFLEQENRTLRHSVTELEIRSVSPEMYRTFQQEIDRGRQKVSDLNAERSHLQVEVQRLEREMRAFNYKVFEESKSRKEAVRELEKLKTELYETKKAYKDAQDNLRLKAQEQDFKTRTHEQDDMSSSTCSAPGSVQGGPVPPGQEVNEVRKEVLNISLELEKLRNENTKVEIDILGTKGELQQYITGTEGNSQLQAEVHQVSHNASTEVTQYVSMLEKREVELETLHHSLQEQREEYEKLMHMKLDLELALKHHGLDYTTIQYDVHDLSPSHHRSSTPKGTPIRRRPLRDMDHSNKKRKTEHPSSADGSFLADEAAYVSAEGGGSASFATGEGRARQALTNRYAANNAGLSQSFGAQGFGTQGCGNQGLGNQSFGTQGFATQGFATQGFGTQGFGTQGFEFRPSPVGVGVSGVGLAAETHADPATAAGTYQDLRTQPSPASMSVSVGGVGHATETHSVSAADAYHVLITHAGPAGVGVGVSGVGNATETHAGSAAPAFPQGLVTHVGPAGHAAETHAGFVTGAASFQAAGARHAMQTHAMQTHAMQTHATQTHEMQTHATQTHEMLTHAMQTHATQTHAGHPAAIPTAQPQPRTPHADVGGASAVLGSAAEGHASSPAPGSVGLYQSDSIGLPPSYQPVGSPVSATALPVAAAVSSPALVGPKRVLIPYGEYVVVDSSSGVVSATLRGTTTTVVTSTTAATSALAVTSAIAVTSSAEVTSIPTVSSLAAGNVGTTATSSSLVPTAEAIMVASPELPGPERLLLPSGEYVVANSTGKSTTVVTGATSTVPSLVMADVEKVSVSELVGPKRFLLPSGEYVVVDSSGGSTSLSTDYGTNVTPGTSSTASVSNVGEVEKVVESELVGPQRVLLSSGEYVVVNSTGQGSTAVTNTTAGTVTADGVTPGTGAGTGSIGEVTPGAAGTGTIGGVTPVAGATGTIGGVTPVAGGTGAIGGVTPVAGGTVTIGGLTPVAGGTGAIGGVTPVASGTVTIGRMTPVAGGTGTIGEVTPNVGSTSTIGGVTPVGNGTNTTIGVTRGTGTTAAVTSVVSGTGTISGVTAVDVGTGTTVESVALVEKVESVPVPGLSGPERIITPSGEYIMSSPSGSVDVIDGASTTVVSAKDVGETTTGECAAVADTYMGTAIATSTTVASTTTLGETVKVSCSVNPEEVRTVVSANSADSRDVMPSPHFDEPDTPFHKGAPDLALSVSASNAVQSPQTPQAGTVVSGSATHTATFRIGDGYGIVTNIVQSPQTPQAGTAVPGPAAQGADTAKSRIGEGYGVVTSVLTASGEYVVAAEGKEGETTSDKARPVEDAAVGQEAVADVAAATVAGAGVQQGFNGGKQGTYGEIVTGHGLLEAQQVSDVLSADDTEPTVECMLTLSNAPGATQSIIKDTINAPKVMEKKRETPFAGADDTIAPGDGQADSVTDTELAGESFSSTVAVAGSYVDIDGSINAPVVSAFIEECVSGEPSVLLEGACYQGVSLDRAVEAATACVHLAAVAKAGVSSFIVRPDDENPNSANGIGDVVILYTENPDSVHGIGDVFRLEDKNTDSAHGIGDIARPGDEVPDSAYGIGDVFRLEDKNTDSEHGIGDIARPGDEVPNSAHGIGDIARPEDEVPDSAHGIGDDEPSTKINDDAKKMDVTEPTQPATSPASGVTATLSEVSTDATSRPLIVATSTDVIETETVVPATSQAVGSEVYSFSAIVPTEDADKLKERTENRFPDSSIHSVISYESSPPDSGTISIESRGQSGCVISETYTIDESTSRQQTRLSQTNGTAGGGGDGQLAMAEARAVDAPGLSGPRRVLTASGEYVVASATSTVRRSGEAGDTAMGMTFDQTTTTVRAEDRPGLSGPKRVLTASGEYVMEDQTTTTTVTTEDRSGLSGPKRVLTASGEYVVVTSSSEDQTTTSTVTTEDRPGLSGPKRVLTASGEYVIAASSEEQTTTSMVTAKDRPGLSGPKRVLTASGEYVVVTSSSEDQTTTTTVQAEDSPGLSGPKRVLTASGEYVLMSSENQTTTTTVTTEDRPGLSGPKRVLTASGEYVVMSSEDQTTTTTVTTEDRSGLSGPKRVLTASGEYVVMSSEDQTTKATTVQAEDRPGLSGPKRVLTASGEYVVEDQTTTTVTTEDRSGLSGPKRVLTASGEYVVVTSSSEHQTTTTTKGGVSTEQVKRVAGAREAGTGGYLGTDDVDGTRVTSGGYVAESSTEQRVREGGEGTQKYSMGVTETTTTKKRRSKGGKGHAEGSTTSYSLHQETQTKHLKVDGSRDDVDYKQEDKVGVLGHAQLDVTNWSSVSSVFNEKTGNLATSGRSTDDVAPSDVATTILTTGNVSETEDSKRAARSREDSGVSVTTKTDAQWEKCQEENVVTTHNLGNEPLVKDDFGERVMSGREITQDRTATGATSFSGNTQMGVQMWGKFPTTQAQTNKNTITKATSSTSSMKSSKTSNTVIGISESGVNMTTSVSGTSSSGSGLSSSGSGLSSSGSGLSPSGSGLSPSGSGLSPSGSGLSPSGSGLSPSGSGLSPSGSGLSPSGSGLSPSGSGLSPSGSGLSSSGSGLSPSGSGPNPSRSGISISGSVTSLSESSLSPSGSGLNPSGSGPSSSGSDVSLQTLSKANNTRTLLNSQLAVHLWGRLVARKSSSSGRQTSSVMKADPLGGPIGGDSSTSHSVTTVTSSSTSTELTSADGAETHPVHTTSTFSTDDTAEVQESLGASSTKSGWWRFFGRQSTVKTTGLTSPSVQHGVTSQRASGFQQLESNFWGKSLGRENTLTSPTDTAEATVKASWWSRLLGGATAAAASTAASIHAQQAGTSTHNEDQDEIDASSAKSGWWRFFSRQSTTSSTTHSSQSAQRDMTSQRASGMTQLGSNSWGKTVRRETTLMRGVDETDTTAVSTSAVTSTESNVTSGSKTTSEKGASLVDGSGKASRTCFARIGRLCVWLLPLLFLLLLLFFLLSSLLPGGMLGMFLGWERGSCHLQNSFRQSWRFMLKHRSPPPI